MTGIDIGIAAFTLFMAMWGYSQGLIVGALSLAGFAGGAVLGSRIAPVILSDGSASPFAPLFVLVGALLAGGILASGLELLGVHLRGRLGSSLGGLDGAAGAVLTAALGLLLVWIAGAVALQTVGGDRPAVRQALQRSTVLSALNRRLPPSGSVLKLLARFDPVPRVDGPEAGVRAPSARIARDPQVRAAQPSVVRVLGTACGLGVQGSGWVAGDGVVVTNAHVVAGQEDTTVQLGGDGPRHDADAIWFDPRNDLAILAVSGIRGTPALRLRTSARVGTSSAVLGFPKNGPYDVRPARLGPTTTALSQDSYGRGPLKRRLTAFRGLVRPGNSGGPMVDGSGAVVTTVFASRVGGGPNSGLGVPARVTERALRAAGPRVGTGQCA